MNWKEGFFLELFTEQMSAYANLCEKWGQFFHAFVGQRRDPLANFIEFGVVQLCCCTEERGVSASPTLESARKQSPAVKRIRNHRRSKLQPPDSFLSKLPRQTSFSVCPFERLLLMDSWRSMSMLLKPGMFSPAENSSFDDISSHGRLRASGLGSAREDFASSRRTVCAIFWLTFLTSSSSDAPAAMSCSETLLQLFLCFPRTDLNTERMVCCAALSDTEPVACGGAPGSSWLTALSFSVLALPPKVQLEFVWHLLTSILGELRSISANVPNVSAASSRCLRESLQVDFLLLGQEGSVLIVQRPHLRLKTVSVMRERSVFIWDKRKNFHSLSFALVVSLISDW